MNIKIGAKGAALSSDLFEVWSTRENQTAYLRLKNGKKESFSISPSSENSHTGTIVSFIPSQEVYNLEPIKIDFEEIKKMCRDWSYLCNGLKFDLTNHTTNDHVI